MSDNSLRLAYLKAIGIDVWVSRHFEQIPTADFTEAELFATEISIDTSVQPTSWEALQQSIATCKRCLLANSSVQPYPGKGGANIEWLLITDEPTTFKNTTSDAGLLLTQMVQALGLDLDKVWVTSAVKCPVSQQNPLSPATLAECRSFLEQQIAIFQPRVILIFGETAAQSALQTQASLLELRGTIHKFAAISTIVTYHPHFLLQTPLEKRAAWTDLQLAWTAYHEVNRL